MTVQYSTDNKALYDLRDELKDLNISLKESSAAAGKMTLAMFLIAVVQVLVAVFQLIITFAYSDNTKLQVLGITMVLATSAIIVTFGYRLFPKNRSDEKTPTHNT